LQMNNTPNVLDYIEKFSYSVPGYIYDQLKEKRTIELITQILSKSDKETSEAVIVLISVIKYISGNRYVFEEMEHADSFQDFIDSNFNEILSLSIEKKVQGNLPERAFPLLELFNKKLPSQSITVIELGASYGMVGRSLLDPNLFIKNRGNYFFQDQKIPKSMTPIGYYLGLELAPPDERWLYSSVWYPDEEQHLRNIINDFSSIKNFRLIKGNAMGFSLLDPVKKIVGQSTSIVILTSFMLYQLNTENRNNLKNEILEFIKATSSNWINQTVDILSSSKEEEYSIEWNGVKIMGLKDDRCSDWRWT
jgi:hypothetical protein